MKLIPFTNNDITIKLIHAKKTSPDHIISIYISSLYCLTVLSGKIANDKNNVLKTPFFFFFFFFFFPLKKENFCGYINEAKSSR